MRTLYLAIVIFIQLLLTTLVLQTLASPISEVNKVGQHSDHKHSAPVVHVSPSIQASSAKKVNNVGHLEAKKESPNTSHEQVKSSVNIPEDSPVIVDSAIFKEQTKLMAQKQNQLHHVDSMVGKKSIPVEGDVQKVAEPVQLKQHAEGPVSNHVVAPISVNPVVSAPVNEISGKSEPVNKESLAKGSKPSEGDIIQAPSKPDVVIDPRSEVPVVGDALPKQDVAMMTPAQVQASKGSQPPVVKGGQGPLHLLAATLCIYQPDRPTLDEKVSSLYAKRASLRKSLFDFMSLKFTHLEKLSTRLNPGLEVMPPKSVDSSNPGKLGPTHGWPLVGKCTAHDLKLMAEAAWCECSDPANCDMAKARAKVPLEEEKPKKLKRSIDDLASLLPIDPSSPNSPVIIPKLVDSIINGQASRSDSISPIESSLANLNLTQQQLSVIQAQAGLTQECKRNSLRLAKALFNHLAEDQSNVSDSWPKLYLQMTEDDCARERMIDIVTALSGFRTESTSIRRDNVEFAFAMDDLRTKVLESDINAPLTFDKHFIEVEQFLQQSVKLMLANIDPERAKLTSMRYRSLMPGPLSVDDQCVQLHQLLLAKNHPTDCNPNQYGQLPDVLRMTANSLALWSIENELSRLVWSKSPEYNPIAPLGPNNKQDINACIANLVSS